MYPDHEKKWTTVATELAQKLVEHYLPNALLQKRKCNDEWAPYLTQFNEAKAALKANAENSLNCSKMALLTAFYFLHLLLPTKKQAEVNVQPCILLHFIAFILYTQYHPIEKSQQKIEI